METQTPSSISEATIIAEIRNMFKLPGEYDKLMYIKWSKTTYECTKLGKAGIFSSRPDTARVVATKQGEVEGTEHLLRLRQTHPMLAKLNDTNMQGGSIAVVSSAENIEIDGTTSGVMAQSLIIVCLHTEDHAGVVEAMKKVAFNLKDRKATKVCVAF